ncbi:MULTISPECIES: RagB/SusD family nutrient uptake outer membrane protein [unclassified Carboxylicivirga]|uniref:RagB/SusD family nutrient uptake outer membrane protein n=1 Tax=Carboxylicivirga TaxID=1628153 RepID=UPI003D3414A7
MKRVIYMLIVAVGFISCNDNFLDRYPIAEIAPENSFKTEQDLKLYTNSFYNDLPSINDIVKSDNISDNVLYNGVPGEQSGLRIVPSEAGSGGWSWSDLRKINTFFKYYEQCDSEVAKREYSGVAYFFRAWFYFEKVKRFGDVPWYTEVVGSGDTELLTKPRDSRVLVIDNIIADLDAAIENLNDDKASDKVTKWAALALKSRVCLFEGTFRKYHSDLNLPDSDKLLELSWQAAQEVIDKSPYSLYETGNPHLDYRDLFASNDLKETEVILGRRYSSDLDVIHSINYYFTSATQQDVGLSKTLINSYLMSNGSAFTDQAGYELIEFVNETKNRDRRLEQTIRTPGYMRIGGDMELLPDFSASMTGYQVVKFVSDERQDGNQSSYQDVPIIRFAEVLLNYAEARAELGIIDQADVDKSIRLIRNRVGMPNLDVANANSNPDSYLANQYPNVIGDNKGIVLEVRRERRIELAMEGFRYNDLMRWKAGKILEEYIVGMYFPSLGEFDLDGDGTMDVLLYEGDEPPSTATQKIKLGDVFTLTNGDGGNLVAFTDREKSFDESRDYLYPIPSGDILLNPALEQNRNWK